MSTSLQSLGERSPSGAGVLVQGGILTFGLIHHDDDSDWERGVLAVAISSPERLISLGSAQSGGFGETIRVRRNFLKFLILLKELEQKLLFSLNWTLPFFSPPKSADYCLYFYNC